MKNIRLWFCFLSFIILFFLTSCVSKKPEAVNQFERIELKTANAKKEEWERIKVDDNFSYVSDFNHSNYSSDNEEQYFIRFYYQDKLIYEEYSKDTSFSLDDTKTFDDQLFYAYTANDDIDFKKCTVYCLVVNKDGLINRFSLEGNYTCIGLALSEDFCYFLVINRVDSSHLLIKTDKIGNLLSTVSLDKNFWSLYYFNNELYTTNFKTNSEGDYVDEIYLLNEDGTYNLITVMPGNAKISFNNNLKAFSYCISDNKYKLYKYSNNELKLLTEFELKRYKENDEKDKICYTYKGFIYSNNKYYLAYEINGDTTINFYNKMMVLVYDELEDKMKIFYEDSDCENVLVRNGTIFFGKYTNGSTNKTSDGKFKKIILT